jgi:hypothetical protein
MPDTRHCRQALCYGEQSFEKHPSSVLASSEVDQVKPKTIKLVFVAYPLKQTRVGLAWNRDYGLPCLSLTSTYLDLINVK